MSAIRRKDTNKSVWIPLRAQQVLREIGHHGYEEHQTELYQVGSVLFPINKVKQASKLTWEDVGISEEQCGHVEDAQYIASDVFRHPMYSRLTGVYPVLYQSGTEIDPEEWHLHQDIVLSLGLLRKGDEWLRPKDDYAVTARLHRCADGSPTLVEFRALYLKDYLCARDMGLLLTTFRLREAVIDDASIVGWPQPDVYQAAKLERWEGHIDAIHEGGQGFGTETLVIHSNRIDIAVDEDVPELGLPTNENIEWSSQTHKGSGRKLFRISGRLWKNEWIAPGDTSPIVRRDTIVPNVSFVIDASGTRENASELRDSGRWLWFGPTVIGDLASRRGGALGWYTRDTGWVRASPNQRVHYGINSLGLITVYAQDIAWLPEWQLRIWAGHNVPPDGGISGELHASQVLADPADTRAPEAFLQSGLVLLNMAAKTRFGRNIVQEHDDTVAIFRRCHRFRATSNHGLLELAKDLARVTADSFDKKEIQAITLPPVDPKLGGLKSLESLLATIVTPDRARTIMGPLHGVYNLRLGDAHLASGDIDEAYKLVRIDRSAPLIIQGGTLLAACVGCIYEICRTIDPTRFEES